MIEVQKQKTQINIIVATNIDKTLIIVKEYYDQANINKFQKPDALAELLLKYKVQPYAGSSHQ
jgi:hypothetical protein